MKEVTRSNLNLTSRNILREQALAAWRSRPSDTAKDHDAAWIFQASQAREMEIVIKALVWELNSRPDEGVITRASNEKIAGSSQTEIASSSMSSSCDPGIPSQATVEAEASKRVEVSDSKEGQSEAPGTRTPPAETLSRSCNNQRSIPAMNKLICKKRSRRGNRAPITFMSADPADFRAMVEHMTGYPIENSSKTASSVLKPQPKWPGQIGSNIIPSASSSEGFPVAINGLFVTRPNYLHPTAFCNNLAENSSNTVGAATSSSHINSIEINKANNLQSQINAAFALRDFWN